MPLRTNKSVATRCQGYSGNSVVIRGSLAGGDFFKHLSQCFTVFKMSCCILGHHTAALALKQHLEIS